MSLKNVTGWNIRQIRIARGMTVYQLSSALPTSAILSSGEVAEIEVGTRKAYDYEIQGIARALGVTVADIFTPHKKVKKNAFRPYSKTHFHVITPP